VTDIAHLALGVRDPARSLAFYRDFVVTTPKGISFSLIRGEPPEGLGEVHFGVALPGEEAVRTRRAELAAMGIPEVDWWVEPGFVSLKVADPDGYVVEFFWGQA
jgi:catechol 2,3-dioxygenase-like lactoylglutathione lyase family enzyme